MKQTSLMWMYSSKLTNDKSKCKTCDKEASCKNGSTIGMREHLKDRHKVSHDELDARKPREIKGITLS